MHALGDPIVHSIHLSLSAQCSSVYNMQATVPQGFITMCSMFHVDHVQYTVLDLFISWGSENVNGHYLEVVYMYINSWGIGRLPCHIHC